MKTFNLEFDIKDKDNLNEIALGLKTIETRAASEKYKDITAGDTLVFSCGKERLSKIVKETYHFKSIEDMTDKIHFKKIMPNIDSIEEMKKVYSSYPNYDKKIKKFGIYAFFLK